MATPPPPAELLGQLLLHALGAGATSRTLGEFARLQCGAGQAIDTEAFGVALMHLVQAGADTTVVGRFAVLIFSARASAAERMAEAIPAQATMRDLVREEIRTELLRSPAGSAGRRPARRGTILKLTLSTGRTTSLSLPKELVEAYRAAFSQAALTALLKDKAGGAVPAGSTRSHLARVALEEALGAHRAVQASRGPLTLVSG